MATKKKSKTPAARYLRYELTNSGSAGTETSHYIDLARDLSRINRRLYRQGRDYHVKRISIVSSNTIAGVGVYDQTVLPGATTQTQNAGRVTFGTIPDGWVARQAWRRGFTTWNAMNKKAMTATGNSVKGTWSDFKVHLSNDMRNATPLNPLDNGGNAYNSGEWVYSQLVSPDGTTSADSFELHMMGDHAGSVGAWGSVGLIKSYGESRATVIAGSPRVPAEATDDPLVNVFDDGTVTDEIIEDLSGQNDESPYNLGNYPGDDGNGPKPMVVQQTTLGADGRATVGGFNALCGLIEIEATSPIPGDVYSVLVELAPGNYRGIAADVIA
jgi:hypothetical protein